MLVVVLVLILVLVLVLVLVRVLVLVLVLVLVVEAHPRVVALPLAEEEGSIPRPPPSVAPRPP